MTLDDTSCLPLPTIFPSIQITYVLQASTTQALDFLGTGVFNILYFGGLVALVETDTEFVAYCHFACEKWEKFERKLITISQNVLYIT